MATKTSTNDCFDSFRTFRVGSRTFGYYSLVALEEQGVMHLDRLPYSIRILLEAVLRNVDGFEVTRDDVVSLAHWSSSETGSSAEIPLKPARVILQDFTGVPAVVDLAAMRSAMKRLGGDPGKINPLIPVDLVIDHSVQTDFFGTNDALTQNVELEFKRNRERYSVLHWAQQSLDNFRVVPPSVGIIHQVNLEFLARLVMQGASPWPEVDAVLYPDSVVGTDSHTVMVNSLGVLGWGVGGIEAEAVMLGQPYYMLAPQVIGMELIGQVAPGVTATDIVLTLTELLRQEGVVGKFVEFFGEGVQSLSVADRAVLANMAPEYGATMGFFPTDHQTIEYLRQTGRSDDDIAIIDRYMKEQRLFFSPDFPLPEYTKRLALDLSQVEPSLAGPKRPQDRVSVAGLKDSLRRSLQAPLNHRGFALSDEEVAKTASVDGTPMGHGAVVIASITSCTNTSNPELMIAAGLLARNAHARGLEVKPYVKTSLGPGSRVVTDYLKKANLLDSLEALGFNVVGYGCLTCIGNSGPLPEPVAKAIVDNNLVVSAVLSGNRNFEGRVNPLVKANYLASPPLVVAYAIAGTTDIDLTTQPLGTDSQGKPVMLADIFPTREEISQALASAIDPELYRNRYRDVYESNELWNAISAPSSELYSWDNASTYIQEPPFLTDMERDTPPVKPITNARALLLLGDSVTTDHISPAGAIKKDSPAGAWLQDHGVAPNDFNSYGSRRGNDRVMTKGTFANIRIRNLLVPGSEGGVTKFFTAPDTADGEVMSVYDAAAHYQKDATPLVVLAGAEYGTGSSRDWAAKGTSLLGIRAVIAVSFERIHRGNLVGMGVLPLEFLSGENVQTLGLDGTECYSIEPLGLTFTPGMKLAVVATAANGQKKEFSVRVRIDTPVELTYYRNGGIIQTVLRKLLEQN